MEKMWLWVQRSYKSCTRNLVSSTKDWRQTLEFFFQIPKDLFIFSSFAFFMYFIHKLKKTFRDWICLYRLFSRCKIESIHFDVDFVLKSQYLGILSIKDFKWKTWNDQLCNGWTLLNKKKHTGASLSLHQGVPLKMFLPYTYCLSYPKCNFLKKYMYYIGGDYFLSWERRTCMLSNLMLTIKPWPEKYWSCCYKL